MNTQNTSSDTKTKNITIGSILGWIMGVGAILAAFSVMATKPIISGLYILIVLILIPPVSRWLEAQTKIRLSKGVKILAVLVLFWAIGTNMNGTKTASNVTAENQEAKAEQAIQVTATKLIADYKANEVSADAMYEGKLIEVKGTVHTIAKDILDMPYITLSGGDPYGIESVQCVFAKEQEAELAGISKGKPVTLQGRVSGKLLNIIVRECRIVQ